MVASKLRLLPSAAALAVLLSCPLRAENARAAATTAAGTPAASDPAPSPSVPVAATPVPAKSGTLKTLPDFTLPDLEGKAHPSKEWRGKVVLVDFWATWCAGCRETIPALARLQEKFGPKGLAVVGISLDKGSPAKVRKFARKFKINYQVLLDSEDTLSKVFGFEALPSLYLFDARGNLVKSMAGYTAAQDKELEGLVAAQFKGKP